MTTYNKNISDLICVSLQLSTSGDKNTTIKRNNGTTISSAICGANEVISNPSSYPEEFLRQAYSFLEVVDETLVDLYK